MVSFAGIVPISDWGVFDEKLPRVIAGPCSAESEEQVMQTAAALKEAGVSVFRAGLWKPRTRPGCFEGVGEAGLPWLRRVQEETGMKVCTEVAGAKHASAAMGAGVDMLWIGARTTANPFLVEEIAETLDGADVPVLVKNPVNPDPDLWAGAVERLLIHGIRKIAVVHRGFTDPMPGRYRNKPEWNLAVAFRMAHPELPFFCDPSHIAGDTKYVPELSQRAMDLGLDGLMVESHCHPSCALSDASQQLTPSELSAMLSSLAVRSSDSENVSYKQTIGELRERIDALDEALVELLAKRMDVCREIGRIKKENNISIIQTERWEKALSKVESAAVEAGLDKAYVKAVFNEIHNASVSEQNNIIENR